jgi:hypothetical protein
MRKVVERLVRIPQRTPQPCREIDVGGAAYHFAHRLETAGSTISDT